MGTTAPVISAANFLSRLEDPDTVVVDVRELDEFAEWHIPGAA
jgi:rhodanese-related sulfurtransferase